MATFVSPAPAFDAVAALGIGGIALVMAVVALWLCVRYARMHVTATTVALGGWMLVTAGAATSGFLTRFDLTPPPMALLMASVFGVAFGVGLSPLGRRLARALPIPVLVGVQAFRLPLELVMRRAAERGIMPVELSFAGYNLDIIAGALALVLVVSLRLSPALPRSFVWAWNVWGLWCLAVIASIAVTTSPMVRAFGDDPAHVNTWVLYFPYVWLPTVLVVFALIGHLVLTRALLARP
jgi:hypothetical protein